MIRAHKTVTLNHLSSAAISPAFPNNKRLPIWDITWGWVTRLRARSLANQRLKKPLTRGECCEALCNNASTVAVDSTVQLTQVGAQPIVQSRSNHREILAARCAKRRFLRRKHVFAACRCIFHSSRSAMHNAKPLTSAICTSSALAPVIVTPAGYQEICS